MGKVYVGNLSYDCTDDQLREHFEQVGKVKSVEVAEKNGRKLGFGYVEVDGDIDALVTKFHQTDFLGRTLKVEQQQDKSERPATRKPRGRARRVTNSANYRGGNPVIVIHIDCTRW